MPPKRIKIRMVPVGDAKEEASSSSRTEASSVNVPYARTRPVPNINGKALLSAFISFQRFKEILLQCFCNASMFQFSHVSVNSKQSSFATNFDTVKLSLHDACIINAAVMTVILDAYNELRSEKKINDNTLDFSNFSVYGDTEVSRGQLLTKKQFNELVKLGIKKFVNITIIDEKPFPFWSLALQCGQRAKVIDGVLKIPDNAQLTQAEWALLQNTPISFSFGKNVSVQDPQPIASTSTDLQLDFANHDFERAYKMRSLDSFQNYSVSGNVSLACYQKTNCHGFNIQNATFRSCVSLHNAVFNKSEVNGAKFNGGIIFNGNTDFTQWNGNVKMPDNAPIVYVNEKGVEIRTTVNELYDALKEKYNDSRMRAGFFATMFGRNFITQLEKKYGTTGERLFKLLQHIQEQNKTRAWSFGRHRTLDAFNAVMDAFPQQPPSVATLTTLTNHDFERAYKTQLVYDFHDKTIEGDVDLSTIHSKKTYHHFNIQRAVFTGSVNLCNAVFAGCQTAGANLNGGIIFNGNTDFTKWSGAVDMPDDASIVYVNRQGVKIHTTVNALYDELKKKYYELRDTGFFARSRDNYIADALEAKNKSGEAKFATTGEKLFKLLQHIQEQNKTRAWSFGRHRTLDAFNAVMDALAQKSQQEEPQPSAQPIITPQEQRVVAGSAPIVLMSPSSTPADAKLITPSKPLEKKLTSEEEKLQGKIVPYIEQSRWNEALRNLQQFSVDTLSKEIKKDIRNAIHQLRDNAYYAILQSHDPKKIENLPAVQRLSKFLNSDLAKHSLIAALSTEIDLSNFVKAAPLSIELTQCLMTLKINPNACHADKLANLFDLANQAQGLKYLYWIDRASCDDFKHKAKSSDIVQQSLADILPAGAVNTPRFINTKNIQTYILTALGLMSPIINIGATVNDFLSLPQFSWIPRESGKIKAPTYDSPPIYKQLYKLEIMKDTMMGQTVYDPDVLLKQMQNIVTQLKSSFTNKTAELKSLAPVETAISNALEKIKGSKQPNPQTMFGGAASKKPGIPSAEPDPPPSILKIPRGN